MRKTIALFAAVAFLCGGLQEVQADVTVLKRYADGKSKLEKIEEETSDGVPNTWFLINDDVDLLEIIYLGGRSSSGDGVTQFSLNGCANLTNFVVCVEPNGDLIFRLGDAQMDAKTLKIRAVEEQEFEVFYYNEEGYAVFPIDDFWSAPMTEQERMECLKQHRFLSIKVARDPNGNPGVRLTWTPGNAIEVAEYPEGPWRNLFSADWGWTDNVPFIFTAGPVKFYRFKPIEKGENE